MALSTQVKESVQQATEALRDALAFAARVEHPITISMLSDMLSRLESLEHMDEFMERFNSAGIGKEV
jgi:chromosomal replication initiation ATPase DnaA